MGDFLVRNVNHFVALLELDAPADDAHQSPSKSTLFVDWSAGLDFDFPPRETLEIGEFDERTLEARGADFQPIATRWQQVVVDVEGRGCVSADGGAVFERDPAPNLESRHLPVDNHADNGSSRLTEVAYVDQLDAVSTANRVDKLL